MTGNFHLDCLLAEGTFRLDRLQIPGIRNALPGDRASQTEEETCLFHRDVPAGAVYLERLHAFVSRALFDRRPAPVVRFADGEYAFYDRDLRCNGLYCQAESRAAIRRALPMHVAGLRTLAETGLLAPLISPPLLRPQRRLLKDLLHGTRRMAPARAFLAFLHGHGIPLTGASYVPFYVVYAYLSSPSFRRLVHGRALCILGSDCDLPRCQAWFSEVGSSPRLHFVEIPRDYVATQWEGMRGGVLRAIPADTEICLVGAGIGALMVCVDVAEHCALPALDAGHVLNLMNGRVDKSGGTRLFTLWEGPSDLTSPGGAC